MRGRERERMRASKHKGQDPKYTRESIRVEELKSSREETGAHEAGCSSGEGRRKDRVGGSDSGKQAY